MAYRKEITGCPLEFVKKVRVNSNSKIEDTEDDVVRKKTGKLVDNSGHQLSFDYWIFEGGDYKVKLWTIPNYHVVELYKDCNKIQEFAYDGNVFNGVKETSKVISVLEEG